MARIGPSGGTPSTPIDDEKNSKKNNSSSSGSSSTGSRRSSQEENDYVRDRINENRAGSSDDTDLDPDKAAKKNKTVEENTKKSKSSSGSRRSSEEESDYLQDKINENRAGSSTDTNLDPTKAAKKNRTVEENTRRDTPTRREQVAAAGSGSYRAFRNELEAGRAEVSQEEQFGDRAFTNPLTGNRVETDLKRAEEEIESRSQETISEGAGDPFGMSGVPAPLALPAATERGILNLAANSGVESLERTARFSRRSTGNPNAGPIEDGIVGFSSGIASSFNPASIALGVKEGAEFATTQPQRLTTQEGRDEFKDDVSDRANQAISSAQQSFRTDPVGSTGNLLGGVAAGFATGTAAGGALRKASGGRVGGSDLSGKAVEAGVKGGKKASGKVKDAVKNSGTSRGQADLTGLSLGRRGGSKSSKGSSVEISDTGSEFDGRFSPDADDAVEQRASQLRIKIDRKRQAQENIKIGGDESPELDRDYSAPRTSGGSLSEKESRTVSRSRRTSEPDIAAVTAARRATAGRQNRAVSLSPRETQLAAKAARDKPTDDFRRVADLERNLLDRETQSDFFGSARRSGRGSPDLERAGASAGTAAGVDSRSDSRSQSGVRLDFGTGGRSGTSIDSRIDTGGRTDVGTDIGSRVDSRVDSGLNTDTRQRSSSDTQNRFDLNNDGTRTRQDTRSDSRTESRFDLNTRQNSKRRRGDFDLGGFDGEGSGGAFSSSGDEQRYSFQTRELI